MTKIRSYVRAIARRKAFCLIVIVLAGGYGGFLAAGYGQDDRNQAWVRGHLAAIKDQLAGLKEHLAEYKKIQGRYPTNNEGLGVLNNFETRFTVYFYRNTDDKSDTFPRTLRRSGPEFWEVREWAMERYHAIDEADPILSKEMLVEQLGCTLEPMAEEDPRAGELEPVAIKLAIDKSDNVFLLSPAGVLSPWMIPYIYENRIGLDQAKFADSPVNRDKKGRFSIRVDDGVYIASIGAECYAERLDSMWWKDNLPRFVGAGLIVVAVVFVIILSRTWATKWGLLVLVGSVGAGVAMDGLGRTTCYIMSAFFSRRSPEMIVRQRELLDTYRGNGVISEETYKKAISAASSPAATQPATAPVEQAK